MAAEFACIGYSFTGKGIIGKLFWAVAIFNLNAQNQNLSPERPLPIEFGGRSNTGFSRAKPLDRLRL
ncbi:hypothetical protein OC25_07605 [Pedobacter kyungheensis]|uniref:Uncharacterized protein n=1 Tax=Pedobacter kyungheensis TaxID=1069985 RepID=A0A0C1DC71_9SPHI|nr:hypothetical protein OC25_07605 [Pedobacter kyungheensis]